MSSSATERFPAVDPAHLAAETRRYFTFFNLIVALIAITFVELILIILPFSGWLLISSLVVLSLAKFVGVIWYFMHLKWDRILLTILFVLGLSLAGGTVAALLLLFEPHPEQQMEEVQ